MGRPCPEDSQSLLTAWPLPRPGGRVEYVNGPQSEVEPAAGGDPGQPEPVQAPAARRAAARYFPSVVWRCICMRSGIASKLRTQLKSRYAVVVLRQAAEVATTTCSKHVPAARLGVDDPSENRQVRCAHRWRTPSHFLPRLCALRSDRPGLVTGCRDSDSGGPWVTSLALFELSTAAVCPTDVGC
jgi:hypothetical protein